MEQLLHVEEMMVCESSRATCTPEHSLPSYDIVRELVTAFRTHRINNVSNYLLTSCEVRHHATTGLVAGARLGSSHHMFQMLTNLKETLEIKTWTRQTGHALHLQQVLLLRT